jgi:dienelactone hydrolase
MLAIVLCQIIHAADGGAPLPGTTPLTIAGEPVEAMVAGIDAHLTGLLAESSVKRAGHWQRDFSSHDAYVESVGANRQRLARIIGAHEDRNTGPLELVTTTTQPALIAEADRYRVFAVRWRVLRDIYGEGLLLEPKGQAVANVVALPDCDWTPEMLAGLADGVPSEAQFARRLAESGCRVLAPVLIDRRDTFSGNPEIRMTNQPHREFVYRAAYEMGRHIIGYEVQKVLAAVDWFEREHGDRLVGVVGCGEGGLVALYSAAVDTRIDTAVVSGYFAPRDEIWSEPIYRNVWSLLHEFGDAEIASLIAPRTVIVEACDYPRVDGPPAPSSGRTGAAPGRIATPALDAVNREVERARSFIDGLDAPNAIQLVGDDSANPGSSDVLAVFLAALGGSLAEDSAPAHLAAQLPDADARMQRQFDQLIEDTQHLMRASQKVRGAFWEKADYSSAEAWAESAKWYREYFSKEVIGELPRHGVVPINPRTRQVFDEPAYRGYEVQLDVYPEVFAYGILLVPKNIPEGERRPVVMCQHGLEGYAREVADPSIQSDYYHQFACKLAEQGFVTYAPQNPYVGGDTFRVLQRKANPLKLSLFSYIVRQHERTIEWLGQQAFVDSERIAFYGLSYGGKTAMRVPAILDGYCLSICSGDFNEWIKKNVTVDYPLSYMFTGEYEMFEWDLGSTFDYGEMAALVFPRPFMVERGHRDGVSYDEWVAHEYAKVRRMYDELGLGDKTTIEYFNGPHTIHGVGTFEFLHEHLGF